MSDCEIVEGIIEKASNVEGERAHERKTREGFYLYFYLMFKFQT